VDGEVTYRLVSGAEALGAAQYLADQQHYIPPPDRTIFWIAERDGKVVGAVALTNTPVVESFCVDEGKLAKGLFAAAEEWIKGANLPRVIAHTAHPYMERLLTVAGAEPMAEEFFVWKREAA